MIVLMKPPNEFFEDYLSREDGGAIVATVIGSYDEAKKFKSFKDLFNNGPDLLLDEFVPFGIYKKTSEGLVNIPSNKWLPIYRKHLKTTDPEFTKFLDFMDTQMDGGDIIGHR